jgi:hypothetical protein
MRPLFKLYDPLIAVVLAVPVGDFLAGLCCGRRAVKRGLALMLSSSLLLSFTFDALSAAEYAKRKEISRKARLHSALNLETALPFRFGSYTIGKPSSKNNFPGVYSAIGTGPVITQALA